MRKHAYILILSILIIAFDLITFIYAKNKGLFVNQSILIFTLLMMILAAFFPSAMYTCYQLIYLDDKKGHLLGTIIEGIHGGLVGGVFIIPFLFSPFFIYDYILFVKTDYRKYKYNRWFN